MARNWGPWLPPPHSWSRQSSCWAMGSIPLRWERPSRWSSAATGSRVADRSTARSIPSEIQFGFRTLFVADVREGALVRDRIETALRGYPGWRLVSVHPCTVAEAERALAEHLLAGPRLGYAEVHPRPCMNRLGSLGPLRRDKRRVQIAPVHYGGSPVKVRAVAISVLAAGALATSAAPAGAVPQNASCVGQFASHFAANQEHPGEFGAAISEEAHFFQPFGANRVSPFAHANRDNCP